MKNRRWLLASIPVALTLTGVGLVTAADDDAPTSAQVAFAQDVSDLLLNELLAALFKEFGETTAANVEQGKQAISLIFNDANRDIRLVGTSHPLGGRNNFPNGNFEETALAAALKNGSPQAAVTKVDDRWYYRRSIALNTNFSPSCVLCHTQFGANQWVGALMLRVPIKTGRDDR